MRRPIRTDLIAWQDRRAYMSDHVRPFFIACDTGPSALAPPSFCALGGRQLASVLSRWFVKELDTAKSTRGKVQSGQGPSLARVCDAVAGRFSPFLFNELAIQGTRLSACFPVAIGGQIPRPWTGAGQTPVAAVDACPSGCSSALYPPPALESIQYLCLVVFCERAFEMRGHHLYK